MQIKDRTVPNEVDCDGDVDSVGDELVVRDGVPAAAREMQSVALAVIRAASHPSVRDMLTRLRCSLRCTPPLRR